MKAVRPFGVVARLLLPCGLAVVVRDFTAPTKHANKNKHRFDGYLILTDGEAYDPGPSMLKRGWVIIPGRKLLFDPSNRDFVINMKEKSEKLAA